jgi:ADP-ribose pyrophosphatase YjhB (NUDIX family)
MVKRDGKTGEPMKREYPGKPIVGVGGIIFKGKTVLLAKRDQEPGFGQWSVPGGAVELGETLEEALRREIREELSVAIHIGGLVRVLDKIIRDQWNRIQYHYVIVDYWGTVDSGTPSAGSDVSEVGWFDTACLEERSVHPEVIRTIRMAEEVRGVRPLDMKPASAGPAGPLVNQMKKPLPMGP